MRPVLVFDVNETLLDLAALDPHFERIFGDAAIRNRWFQQMLLSAFVGTASDRYLQFGHAAAGALAMIAEQQGVELSDRDRQAVVSGLRALPPHPEVADSLEQLRAQGFRLATLTNSVQDVAEAQIESAGLSSLFELVLSADDAGKLKPAPEPYLMAARRLDVPVSDVRLVAAHAWDVTGAIRAGCRAAFVARPGAVLDPNGETPDVIGRDLREVAAAISAAES